jgi:hypothetical protein
VFSSEVDTGSREENTTKQGSGAFRFDLNRKAPGVGSAFLQKLSAFAMGIRSGA